MAPPKPAESEKNGRAGVEPSERGHQHMERDIRKVPAAVRRGQSTPEDHALQHFDGKPRHDTRARLAVDHQELGLGRALLPPGVQTQNGPVAPHKLSGPDRRPSEGGHRGPRPDSEDLADAGGVYVGLLSWQVPRIHLPLSQVGELPVEKVAALVENVHARRRHPEGEPLEVLFVVARAAIAPIITFGLVAVSLVHVLIIRIDIPHQIALRIRILRRCGAPKPGFRWPRSSGHEALRLEREVQMALQARLHEALRDTRAQNRLLQRL
mmetsp:Transcript_38592/g.122319  ORF Transcript_38592/g.122319 Transcript_38592/m.122319 type:complete len:267 (-) Transcript_38592:1910-2710(-)